MPIKKVSREEAIASNIKMEEERQKKINIPKIKIPKDTYAIIKNQVIDNFHLKLNKFAKFNHEKGYKLQNKNINEKFFYKDWNFYNREIKNYYEGIEKLNLKFSEPIELKTNYRLIIGAEESIYETSIRLHHIYGIPYIPASAIKGVVRSYYILENFADKLKEYKDKYNKFEEEILFEDENFKKVFGSQEKEGKIIFFDAFPISEPIIKVDIMNPHYKHYYNDGEAPTDTKNPIPINFLTIEDTTFKFFIASKESLESFKIKDKSIEKWFKEALQNNGIGGKSAVGYGYLEELKK